MKSLLPFALLLTHSLFSQTEKGASPVTNHQPSVTGTTRAVVVGISDYQNLPDLNLSSYDICKYGAHSSFLKQIFNA